VQSETCRVPLAYFQGPTVPGLPRVVREEVDHVPFKINPLGMQPVLVAVFLCEGVCWLAKNAGAGEGVVNALRAALTASGGCPGLFYCVFFLIVFGFSYLDLQDTPKEVSEYLVKIGARIPDVRPGEATVAHLAAMQSGARFFGGASLGVVAVACAAADEWTRQTAGVCVGFTSMLIVTSTILQLKRQIVAMGQMPKLDQVIASV
jgi:preprotein translocase subunit SecY